MFVNSRGVLVPPAVQRLKLLRRCRRGGTRQYHQSRALHDLLTVLLLISCQILLQLCHFFRQVPCSRTRYFIRDDISILHSIKQVLCIMGKDGLKYDFQGGETLQLSGPQFVPGPPFIS